MLREMLDREAQPARPARPDVQPVGSLREELVGQRVAEVLVVDAEVVDVDARLRHAGAAAGFEGVDRRGRQTPSAPSGAPGRRAATRPGRSRTCRDPRTICTSFTGSKSNCFARSSQNGHPVCGSKCQRTISRTCASSRSRAACIADSGTDCVTVSDIGVKSYQGRGMTRKRSVDRSANAGSVSVAGSGVSPREPVQEVGALARLRLVRAWCRPATAAATSSFSVDDGRDVDAVGPAEDVLQRQEDEVGAGAVERGRAARREARAE